MGDVSKPRESYESALAVSAERIRGGEKKLNRLSIIRLFVFLLALAGIYGLGTINVYYAIFSTVVLVIAFLYFVLQYRRVQQQLDFQRNYHVVLQNELNNLTSGANLYSNGEAFSDPLHAYTDDLDIFGTASIFHYVNRCATQKGNERLAQRVSSAMDAKETRLRQLAVRELANHKDRNEWFRTILYPQQSNALNQIGGAFRGNFPSMLGALKSGSLRRYVQIAPFVLIALIALSAFGVLPWKVLLLFFILNYLVNSRFSGIVGPLHEMTGKSSEKLKVFSVVLEWIETGDWQADYLKSLVASCRGEKGSAKAHEDVAALARIVGKLDYRYNMFVGSLLNLTVLWDLRCLFELDQWFRQSANTVLESFEVIGEFEALISLATLAINHPDWAFPEIDEDFKLKASVMGHPLIPAAARICNEYSLEENKTVDIITGSNMSGKSTFLRTIGTNVVLALAGGPVCCRRMECSPIRLVSYMRIRDSLNESTSTFKAEIDRLKMIMERTATDERSFALIDEMLRGTNSRDKYLGTKAFIEKLVSQHSAAIVATHDLQVAVLARKYPGAVRNFHFDIQTDGNDMFFDYKIKQGECTTFNASILLKNIGLDIRTSEPLETNRPAGQTGGPGLTGFVETTEPAE